MIGGEGDDGYLKKIIIIFLDDAARQPCSFPEFLNSNRSPKQSYQSFYFLRPSFPSKRSPRALGQMDAPDKADEI